MCRKFQTSGVTSKMEVRYLRPIRTDGSWIELRARVEEQRRNLVRIAVRIADSEGICCTQATCTYFLFSREQALREFHFTGCRVEEADTGSASSEQ